MAQDVAQDVLGAAEDGGTKVLISPIVIFQLNNPRPAHACPHATLGRHVKDEHVKDAAQGVAEDVEEDVPPDVAQDLVYGARAARALLTTPPPPPSTSSCTRDSPRAQMGSSVAFGLGCGQALPGVPRKSPLFC